jgi:hypothetical protein
MIVSALPVALLLILGTLALLAPTAAPAPVKGRARCAARRPRR